MESWLFRRTYFIRYNTGRLAFFSSNEARILFVRYYSLNLCGIGNENRGLENTSTVRMMFVHENRVYTQATSFTNLLLPVFYRRLCYLL